METASPFSDLVTRKVSLLPSSWAVARGCFLGDQFISLGRVQLSVSQRWGDGGTGGRGGGGQGGVGSLTQDPLGLTGRHR